MKKIFTILFMVITLLACGSSRSFQSFFDTHKTDIGTTAFQVPNFMKVILATISPKQNMFDNLTDLKFISFKNTSQTNKKNLINEMNAIANNRYTDMFRKNTIDNTKIISVKESGNVVTEAIIFDSKPTTTTVFYIKGRFDPDNIKAFADEDTFNKFSKNLQQRYQMNFNQKLNPSFNPNN